MPDALVVTPALGASTPEATESLRQAIAAAPDVQTVQIDTEWVKRLNGVLDMLRRVVVLTAALLGSGVVLVVGNTIRLDILNRRAEIEVMKLVGATDGFARRPFLYSGVWYGLGGGSSGSGVWSKRRWCSWRNRWSGSRGCTAASFTLSGLGLRSRLHGVGGCGGLRLAGLLDGRRPATSEVSEPT